MFEPFKETGARVAGLWMAVLLTGCAGPAPQSLPAPEAAKPQASTTADSIERFQVDLGDGFRLHYQVEKKLSKVNGKSCFAFISGAIHNASGKVLSRRSVLDVTVMAQGATLYRDISNPLSDIRSGAQADFEMVVSPVFADGCPRFDTIKTTLRKVYL
jgi:hypothetical protein